MKTNITLDDDLHAEIKTRATTEVKSLSSFVDDALRRYLAATVSVNALSTLDGPS